MNSSTDMLGDTKGGCKSVDRPRRVSENGEFGYSQIVANNGNII